MKPLAPALLALCLTLSLAPAAQGQLPQMGDGTDLPLSAERKLGDKIIKEIYRDPDYLDDPILSDYVQGIWTLLMDAARLRGDLTPELDERLAWQVLLIRDRTVNAFALPGGYLGVHLGLISLVGSRDELASVMAHELSHVTQRHIARSISKQNQQTPWLIGAMVLGALAASKSPDAANAAIMGGQALALQNQLNFSRDMEREADRVGYSVLTQAGFSPLGFSVMFDRLQQNNRLNDNGSFPYLRSHPLTTERIADMKARHQLQPAATLPQPGPEHAMMTARARILAQPSVDRLAAALDEARAPTLHQLPETQQVNRLYAGVMAANRQREFATASQLLSSLARAIGQDPAAQTQLRWLTAETWLAQQQPTRAAQFADLTPKRRAELLLATQARNTPEMAHASAQALRAWLVDHPQDALAWHNLEQVLQTQGNTLGALRAQAEFFACRQDYARAQDVLRAAQDLARQPGNRDASSHIEASIIDTRSREFAQRLREQASER